MDLSQKFFETQHELKWKLRRFDTRHPAVLDSGIAAALGAIGIGAEAAAMQLADKPHTFRNNLGRASCHAVAVGSAYLISKTYELESS